MDNLGRILIYLKINRLLIKYTVYLEFQNHFFSTLLFLYDKNPNNIGGGKKEKAAIGGIWSALASDAFNHWDQIKKGWSKNTGYENLDGV